MFGLFKYLFFKIYRWNNNIIKNNSYPILGAVIGVSFFQILNIKFITDFIIYVLLDRKDLIVEQGKIVGILIVTIVLVLNGFYYNRYGIKIIEKIKSFTKSLRRKRDVISIAYIIITLITTFGLAFMIRNNF